MCYVNTISMTVSLRFPLILITTYNKFHLTISPQRYMFARHNKAQIQHKKFLYMKWKYVERCIACSFYNFLPTKVYKKRIKNNYVKVIITLVATSRIIFTFSMDWNKQEKCSMSSSRAQCLNVIMLVKYTSASLTSFT